MIVPVALFFNEDRTTPQPALSGNIKGLNHMTVSIRQNLLILLVTGTALTVLPLSTAPVIAQENTIKLDTVVIQTGDGSRADGAAPLEGFAPTATATGSKSSVAIEKSRNPFPSSGAHRWTQRARKTGRSASLYVRRFHPAFRRG